MRYAFFQRPRLFGGARMADVFSRIDAVFLDMECFVLCRRKDRAGVAERAYLVAGFESWLTRPGSPRKGSLNLREISGQNSRSTSKPMSWRML
jgi:hypothetical protein